MKLPQIQYSQAQAATTLSPGQAAAPHLAKANMVEKVGSMINNVLKVKDDQQAANANADYKETLSAFKNWYAKQDSFTPEEIVTMGLEDLVDTSEGNVDAWKVYPHALNKFAEEMREQLGKGISNNVTRQNWETDTIAMTAPEIERSIQDAATMGVQEMVNVALDRYEDAKDRGDYLAASQALNTLPIHTPKLRAEKLTRMRELDDLQQGTIEQDKLESALKEAAITGDYSVLDAMAIEQETAEYVETTAWGDAKHTAWANTIRAERDNAQRDGVAAFKIRSSALANGALRGINEGTVNVQAIYAMEKTLTSSDFRYLLKQIDTENTTVKTEPLTMATFANDIFSIQMGLYSDTLSYSEQIAELRYKVKNAGIVIDPITGERTVNMTSTDSMRLMDEIDDLEARPYKAGSEYAVLAREISQRILGFSDDSMFAGLSASPDSANLNAEAQRSLRLYVDANGGTQADVGEWRRTKLPYYLESKAKLSFAEQPRSLREATIQNPDGKVNGKLTRDALTQLLKGAQNAKVKDPIVIAAHRKDIADFDAWAKGEGRLYVTE